MSSWRLPSRPAALAGVGLLAGVAGQRVGLILDPLLLLALSSVLLAPGRSRRRIAVALVASGLALGAALEARDAAAAARRALSLAPHGRKLETHLVGRLRAPVERRHDGSRRLIVRGRSENAPGAVPWTVSLTAPGTPAWLASRLDRLHVGDRLRIWCSFRAPGPPGNPGQSGAGLRARGLDALGHVKSVRSIELLPQQGRLVWRTLGRLQSAASRRLDRGIGRQGPARELAGAMVLGQRGSISPVALRTLRDAGLLHLVAISGFHVALIAAALDGLLRRLGLGAGARGLILGPALLLYASLVGLRPPVVRATLATLVVLFGRWSGRRGDALNGLAALAALLVASAPGLLGAAGFQLTFLATAGILLSGTRTSERLPTSLRASIGAYVASAPLAAWHFGALAPAGIVATLVAVPACFAILGGVPAALLAADFPIIAVAPRLAIEWGSAWLDGSAKWIGSVTGGANGCPPPKVWALGLYYLALWGMVRSRRRRARRGRFRIARSVWWAMLVWVHLGHPPLRPGTPFAAVADVGQGLAVIVQDGQGQTALIDSGGPVGRSNYDPGERIVVPLLLSRGVRRLEILVLTHDHLDHLGGAAAILKWLEVGEVWIGRGESRRPRVARLVDLARERGSAIVTVSRGHIGHAGKLRLQILAPLPGQAERSTNERSVVVRVGEAPARLLVPGDVGHPVERALLASGANLRAEALVLGHHGSRSSSSAEFLDAVSPRWSVASMGRANPFGHPHVEVIRRLGRRGIRLYRTDVQGLIRLRADKKGWVLRPHLDDAHR